MEKDQIIVTEVVLIGGGHSHIHVLKMLGMDPIKGLKLTLISRDIESPYSGMMPGFVAGCYNRDECHIDLWRLCSFSNVQFICAEVNRINTTDCLIFCSDGRPPIRYDYLSINIGITPSIRPIAKDPNSFNIIPVKPIDKFAKEWDEAFSTIVMNPDFTKIIVAIVGGGAGGVEMSFAINNRIINALANLSDLKKQFEVVIFNRSGNLLRNHNSKEREQVYKKMAEQNIRILLNTEIVDVVHDESSSQKYLISSGGRKFEYDLAIWCTQATGQSWLLNSGLQCTEDGFIRVKPTLQSVNVPNVFACGDICDNSVYPRPKAGVFAVRAGPPLLSNIKRIVLKQPLEEWIPQSEFLSIISTGDGSAISSRGSEECSEGSDIWVWKDQIDKKFMAMYNNLPDKEEMMKNMAENRRNFIPPPTDSSKSGDRADPPPGVEFVPTAISVPLDATIVNGPEVIELLTKSKMRCGGCGSKVGAQILTRVIDSVRGIMYQGPDVVLGAGDDAALLIPPSMLSHEYYTVHTIDYFRSFIADPYIFGQIAANHALSDIHAMNATATSALALCVVPYGLESKVESYLVQLLAGALKVLSKERCSLVGGHTSEGTEPALGFSISGHVERNQVLKKVGLFPMGAKLILTKGLGTGTILAADMRAKARGKWVSNAIESMLQSNKMAAQILKNNECYACTDVTGFGLAGHLLEMVQHAKIMKTVDQFADSMAAVRIFLDNVPMLDGADDCIKQGVTSSLHPQNIRCSRAIKNIEFGVGRSAYTLLFDPQTSGGLLGIVPDNLVEKAITELKDAGYLQASVIGEVVAREKQEDEYDITCIILN